ncbi:restriction endonuclease fold toxin-2 domain-containing protein [Cystobacter ferrugineus]|uniref:restriction endonuclease fold toxin-2 domain-containing protein n=1 Tax=Cystobacter ferrugineus TaxID=83449 RepID=UPI000AE9A84B|nr:restriction endonuclease fold toxin-2 domain-containing protein [Cystobacter ferrugineus]
MRALIVLIGLLFAAPAWANSMEDALCQAPSTPVDRMESTEKFCRSTVRALGQLPRSTANEARALLTPESLALMVTMTTAWAGTQGIPVVGQAVDAALMSIGVILITAQSAALADALWRYANCTSTARSHADLDFAATHLSRAIAAAGVNIVAFILTKRLLGPGRSGSMGPPRGMAAVAAEGAQVVVQTPRSTLQAPALAMTGGMKPPSPTGTAREQAAKTVDPKAFVQWVHRLRKRPTRSTPAAYAYQQRYAGPEEFLVEGGNEQIWADGARLEKARLIEAKFIDAPEKSPFISESKCNENVRRWIQQEVFDEFRRYAAVIAAPETPVVALEVITNDARAVPFFESLLRSFGIPGEVIVRP